MAITTRALSLHASYGCRRTGVCCTSNWPIPVEVGQLGRLTAAMEAGILRPEATGVNVFDPPPVAAPADMGALLGRQSERCVFLGGGRDRTTCRVHEALGHDALPMTCHQFPRVVLHDPRGVSITLSHYCPTAAASLESDTAWGIVTDPEAFPASGRYDGLDASMALPPLLHPEMLMDWPSWWEWERLSLHLLGAEGQPAPETPGHALARMRLAVEALLPWQPSDGPLLARVHEVMDRARSALVEPFRPDGPESRTRITEILEATPADLTAAYRPTLDGTGIETPPALACRFLAAHAFANWPVQLGHGLYSWLRSVEAAWVLLDAGLGVRVADLWLRHLVDVDRLARRWAREP